MRGATSIRRHVTIPADLERVAELRATVREIGAGCQAPADCIGDLVQAVDEAATNIIRYGYGGERGSIDMWFLAPPSAWTRLPFFVPVS